MMITFTCLKSGAPDDPPANRPSDRSDVIIVVLRGTTLKPFLISFRSDCTRLTDLGQIFFVKSSPDENSDRPTGADFTSGRRGHRVIYLRSVTSLPTKG